MGRGLLSVYDPNRVMRAHKWFPAGRYGRISFNTGSAKADEGEEDELPPLEKAFPSRPPPKKAFSPPPASSPSHKPPTPKGEWPDEKTKQILERNRKNVERQLREEADEEPSMSNAGRNTPAPAPKTARQALESVRAKRIEALTPKTPAPAPKAPAPAPKAPTPAPNTPKLILSPQMEAYLESVRANRMKALAPVPEPDPNAFAIVASPPKKKTPARVRKRDMLASALGSVVQMGKNVWDTLTAENEEPEAQPTTQIVSTPTKATVKRFTPEQVEAMSKMLAQRWGVPLSGKFTKTGMPYVRGNQAFYRTWESKVKE